MRLSRSNGGAGSAINISLVRGECPAPIIHPNNSSGNLVTTGLPLGVKRRRTQSEYKESASPPIADIREDIACRRSGHNRTRAPQQIVFTRSIRWCARTEGVWIRQRPSQETARKLAAEEFNVSEVLMAVQREG